MDLNNLYKNLEESSNLIGRYADCDNAIQMEKYRIFHYNKKGRYAVLGLLAGLIVYLFSYHFIISGPDQIVMAGILSFGICFFVIRGILGPLLDKQRKKAMKKSAILKFQPVLEEMNSIVAKLDGFSVLPAKYRTVHAVKKLLEYIQDKRIDSLKEGLNLYEDEQSKNRQQQSLSQMIRQNQQIIGLQKVMINQQRDMIRAQRVTNTLLMFQ